MWASTLRVPAVALEAIATPALHLSVQLPGPYAVLQLELIKVLTKCQCAVEVVLSDQGRSL